jgi:hypothetical protein
MSSVVEADRVERRVPLLKRIDPRWYFSSLLTLILVVGQWKFQILGDSYVPWMVALGTAIGAELVFYPLLRGGWPNLLSAYITGNSVAILTKPDGALIWPFAVASAISIASKYVLNYRKRHLWNPTNFGICMLLVVASNRVTILSHQWGNDPTMVVLIWTVGLLTVSRARVRHITLTYCAAFIVLACLRSAITGLPLVGELSPITGPMYTLFMFFMVTDPRTVVDGKLRQIGVVVLVALAECAIRLACDYDMLSIENPLRAAPPMFALFFVGPAMLALQLWQGGRRVPRD